MERRGKRYFPMRCISFPYCYLEDKIKKHQSKIPKIRTIKQRKLKTSRKEKNLASPTFNRRVFLKLVLMNRLFVLLLFALLYGMIARLLRWFRRSKLLLFRRKVSVLARVMRVVLDLLHRAVVVLWLRSIMRVRRSVRMRVLC